jgi:hypothetical protein
MQNHTVHKASHILTYWKDGVACGPLDNPNKVEVRVSPMSPAFTFDSATSRDIAQLSAALDEAFERGRFAKAKEVANALNLNTNI